MQLSPRYDGPVLVELEGPADEVLVPLARQRRRLAEVLAALDAEQWSVPSRCEGWSVGDVVAHLVSVNQYWTMSVTAGLRGTPTRLLATFDPAATPPKLIGDLTALAPADLLDRYGRSGDELVDQLGGLDEAGWAATAETPLGHVPIRLLAFHALWDCWVHERDIAVPLGLEPAVEADEVERCLRYVAALSPAFAITKGMVLPGALALEATDPNVALVLDVADHVVVRCGAAPAGTDCLRGDAVGLVEGLSVRAPLPAAMPERWAQLHRGGLVAIFDAV